MNDEPYRLIEERCEILAVEMADAGNDGAANVLYEAEALIRNLRKKVAFWINLYGEAVDALDELAGDDEEGWDRQQHAEATAEKLRAKHSAGLVEI